MPKTPERIFEQLGVADPALKTWDSLLEFGLLKPGTMVKKGEALFPRIDVAKEMAILASEEGGAQAPSPRRNRRRPNPRRPSPRRRHTAAKRPPRSPSTTS